MTPAEIVAWVRREYIHALRNGLHRGLFKLVTESPTYVVGPCSFVHRIDTESGQYIFTPSVTVITPETFVAAMAQLDALHEGLKGSSAAAPVKAPPAPKTKAAPKAAPAAPKRPLTAEEIRRNRLRGMVEERHG